MQSANLGPCLNTRDRPLFAACLICTETSRDSLQGSMMYPLSPSLSLSLSLSHETCGFLRITGRNRAVCIGGIQAENSGMPNEIEIASVRAFIGSVNGDDVRS